MRGNIEEKQPLVAVVIPVYNDDKYIAECLDSLLAQTADFWEAWLADDCSSDASAEICEEFCRRDGRFHLIRGERNSSAWACRARGIMSASPSVEYIMFADADDSLAPEAVMTAYSEMKREPVDILHFGTNVVNRGGVSVGRIKSYEKYIAPPCVTLHGDAVFESFVSRNFEGHLWNKMFRAGLLREVITRMGQELYLPKAQDKVLYWAVCRSGDITYRGISKRLYNYNYGYGTEGGTDAITIERCRQFLSQAWSENTIAGISAQDNEKYADIMERSRYNLVKHSVRNLLRLPAGDRPQGFDLARGYWDRPLDGARLSCALAEYTWEDMSAAAAMLAECSAFLDTQKPRDIRVVGTYYHRMDNGGIQRVIAQVIGHWHSLGLEVVLFTDFDPTDDDYRLPEYVTRVKIARPFSHCTAENYHERGMSLARLLKEYHVDCMVYHSYFSDVLLYDTCVCRSEGVHFVLHQHNVFSRYLRYGDAKFSTIPQCARLADAVVCLSGADREWWSCFNPRTSVVLNPLTFDLDSTPCSVCDDHTILFLGRLSEEAKHPLHAVEIAAQVVKRFPDAKLLIVGTGDPDYMKLLKKRISALGMERSVELCGFHRDVEQFYLKSSVFLSCSSHEGFMLTLCEAMSYSIPVVMYDLPYLAPVQENDGIVSVPQNSVSSAAEAICLLFADDDLRRNIGEAGRRHLEQMYRTDIAAQWRGVFASLTEKPRWEVPEDRRVMAQTMVSDYLDGLGSRSAYKPPLMFRIKRYYRQFGLRRSIKRAFEKLSGK